MYNLDEIPPEWRCVAQEHEKADSKWLDHKAFGVDDKLDNMLDAKAKGVTLSKKKLRNLTVNRARRHQERRQLLLGRYAYSVRLFDDGDLSKPLIVAEEVGWIRSRTTDAEWHYLWRLRAEGRTYLEVASETGVTLGTLKSSNTSAV